MPANIGGRGDTDNFAHAIDIPLPHLFTGTSTTPHAMADSFACLLDKLPENRRLFLYSQIEAWCDYFNSERIFTATTDKKQE